MTVGLRVLTVAVLVLGSAALDAGSKNAAQLRATARPGPPSAANTSRAASWFRRVEDLGRGASFPIMTVLHSRASAAPQGSAGSAPTGPEANDSVSATEAAITWVTTQVVYLVFALIVAYFYKSNKDWVLGQEMVKTSEKNFKEWTSPEIEPILCWSFVCPSVRWADTMAMAGILPGFWQAMVLFVLVSIVAGVAFGLPGWLLMTCFLVVFRIKIRSKFEMQNNIVADFCCYCFCQPCLVAQEARHVEEAHAAGNLL